MFILSFGSGVWTEQASSTSVARLPNLQLQLNNLRSQLNHLRSQLTCDGNLITCDRNLTTCDHSLLTCNRNLVTCDQLSCDRNLLALCGPCAFSAFYACVTVCKNGGRRCGRGKFLFVYCFLSLLVLRLLNIYSLTIVGNMTIDMDYKWYSIEAKCDTTWERRDRINLNRV